MRYLQRLIDQIRKQTENEDVSDFVGIKDSEFVQYINDAQHRLQGLIAAQHPKVFLEENIQNVVDDQEKYDLPSDCFLDNKVHNVEYSSNGEEDGYYTLEETSLKRKNSGVQGSPTHYIRMSGKILLSPQPSGAGKIKITYIKKVKELDLRRALVSYKNEANTATSSTISNSQRWKIHLDYAAFTTDTDSLKEHDYICVVDHEGNSIVKNIKLASEGFCYDKSFETNTTRSACALDGGTWDDSGVKNYYLVCEPHTIDSNSGETATVIPEGAYIIGGKDITSHCELPRSVERYLIAYCAWKILKRDSSVDSKEAEIELGAMAKEIVNSYALISDDVQFIPQLNSWDDWSVN